MQVSIILAEYDILRWALEVYFTTDDHYGTCA